MTKTYLFFAYFFIFTCSHLLAQNGIQWSDPIDVSLTSGNKSPVVGTFNDGNPVLIWGNGSTILFTKMVDGLFIQPITVPTGSNSPNIYSFGGIDMAIKDNQIFIVYENFDNGIFIIKSSDEGNSFQAPVNVYDPIPGKWATLSSVAIDDNGNPLVSVILENTNETQGQFVMMRSLDAGDTFTSPVVASEAANGDYVCECCPSDIYTAGEDVWLVFRNNDNNLRDMWVTKSDDNGDSFDQGVDVDNTDWILNSCPISGPKIAPLSGDSLMTIWKSGGIGAIRVYISTLNGSTMEKGFEMVLPLSNTNAIQGSSNIAGANDTIGIVWDESGFGANGTDLMFALSTNGSQGLISNLSNITEATGTQKFPSLVFSDGVFHLFHTNGSGLQYRSGLVADLVATNELVQNTNCFALIENPSTNRMIRLKNTCQLEDFKFDATLSDLSGKIIGIWNNKNFNFSNEFNFKVPMVPTGVYLLSISSKDGMWSEQVFIE